MDETLKRCPCCGGNAKATLVLGKAEEEEKYSAMGFVSCNYCGLEIEIDKNNTVPGRADYLTQAKAAWEKRIPVDKPLSSYFSKGLFPCPFCGSEAKILYADEYGNKCDKSSAKTVAIGCTNKHCHAYILSDSVTLAKLSWNQRK